MSNLPCGVTDADIDGYDPTCERCGHLSSEHYDDDEYIYNSNGEIVSACDIVGCHCDGFSEGFYDPYECGEYE